MASRVTESGAGSWDMLRVAPLASRTDQHARVRPCTDQMTHSVTICSTLGYNLSAQ